MNLVDVLAGRADATDAIVSDVHSVDVIPGARELAGVEMWRPVSTSEGDSGWRLAVKRCALGPAGRRCGDGAGVPVAGAVGERAERVAQAVIAAPAGARDLAFAGLDRDRGLACVAGGRLAGWVAGAAVD